MNELSKQKTMTVKEISKAFNLDESTIQKRIKVLFPEIIKNGVTTYLNEVQTTQLKLGLEKNGHLGQSSELPKTKLEKNLIIQQALNILQEEIIELKNEIIELKTDNENIMNRVKLLIHDIKTYTSTELAKELNLKSATELNILLFEKGIQYKLNGTWVLYSKYSNLGLVEIKQTELENGRIVYDRHWTGEGRNFILLLFQESL